MTVSMRRVAALVGVLALVVLVGCAGPPKVHVSGTSDEVEDWRVSFPF